MARDLSCMSLLEPGRYVDIKFLTDCACLACNGQFCERRSCHEMKHFYIFAAMVLVVCQFQSRDGMFLFNFKQNFTIKPIAVKHFQRKYWRKAKLLHIIADKRP